MLVEKNNLNHKNKLIGTGVSMVLNHSSLIVILLGAVCFLFTNIILKEILDDTNYGIYSIIVSFLSVIYIYGLLGFEQVFMRFSHQVKQDTITTQKTQIIYHGFIILFTTFLSVLFYKLYFSAYLDINIILLSSAFFCMITTLFLFNIFRLNKNFVLSQIISNGWKTLMCLTSIVFFIYKTSDLELFVDIVLYSIILVTVIALIIILKKIKWIFDKELNIKDTKIAFLNFFIAITAFSIVLFADRFIIESKLGTKVFGDYFYLTTLILSPFSILQNYIGFKQLVRFKQKFDIESFIIFNKKIIAFSIIISLFLMLMIFILTKLDFLNFNFKEYTSTIGLLLLLGIVRLYSSSVLSAFEARTNIDTLKFANMIIVSSTILVSIFVVYVCSTLNGIIVGFIFMWALRSLIYRQLLLRQINKL